MSPTESVIKPARTELGRVISRLNVSRSGCQLFHSSWQVLQHERYGRDKGKAWVAFGSNIEVQGDKAATGYTKQNMLAFGSFHKSSPYKMMRKVEGGYNCMVEKIKLVSWRPWPRPSVCPS